MKKLLLFTALFFIALTIKAQNTFPNKPEVVLVKGGVFIMGSGYYEETLHTVTLSSYSIGKYPITVGQYKKYCTATGTAMPKAPSWGWNDEHPIVNVNYNDAIAYCNWLGEQYNGDWRLPTEAEWEFAARGGNKSSNYTYSGSNSIDEVAWYGENTREKTQAVGLKKANELGLYDMSGNVWEWCNDWEFDYITAAQTNPKGPTSGTFRVIRGGSWWQRNITQFRVTYRNRINPDNRGVENGFRVVLSQ